MNQIGPLKFYIYSYLVIFLCGSNLIGSASNLVTCCPSTSTSWRFFFSFDHNVDLWLFEQQHVLLPELNSGSLLQVWCCFLKNYIQMSFLPFTCCQTRPVYTNRISRLLTWPQRRPSSNTCFSLSLSEILYWFVWEGGLLVGKEVRGSSFIWFGGMMLRTDFRGETE